MVKVPLEKKVREVSSFLKEPKWLLNTRLSAVALLEKRNGSAEISGFKMARGNMKVEHELKENAVLLTIPETLKRGNALQEQLGKPFTGKETDSYLLALALFTDAVVIAVPAGKPASVSLEISGKPPEYFAVFYLIEDGAEASVFAKSSFAGKASECRGLFAGKRSKIHFCTLQENGIKSNFESGVNIVLGEGSELKLMSSNVGGKEIREYSSILQNERGSRCENYEISLARGSQRFFKSSSHFHSSPNTYSRSVFRYATTGKSQVNVDGKVTIEENAPGSDTYLLAKSLLLSKESISRVVPQLFVHNADVAAGHGSAMAPMPDEELFYLQSRGISESESKLLVLQGFLMETFAKSGFEPVILAKLGAALQKDSEKVFGRG